MSKKPLILIVDDNHANIQVLASLIAIKSYDVAVATGGQKALQFLRSRQPDLILMDILMPDMNGIELCKMIKQNPHYYDIPILFISAKNDEESIVQGFEAGGIDYITKPFRSLELIARISTHLELTQARRELFVLSMTDDLTKAYNRRYFINYIDDHITDKKEESSFCSVILFDIDNFKTINDTLGHPIGDLALQRLARICTEQIADYKSIFSRIGGDEFVITLHHNSDNELKVFVEEFFQKIKNESASPEEKVPLFNISAGITTLRESDENHIDVLKRADKSLYKAKERGKGQPCFDE